MKFTVITTFAISKNREGCRENRTSLSSTMKAQPIYQFQFTAGKEYKMISFTHPNGKVVQYGYENGPAVINTNDLVVLIVLRTSSLLMVNVKSTSMQQVKCSLSSLELRSCYSWR